ncbi:MAG: hypothetical protein AMJ78_07920 [Omnitrophica WOR_2 bacterium SM23_29]|nr:MAG: hypothetical protein AMJ78_07920 [Omnitrophica WOR_2 bacterium SM23_29]
MKNKMSLICGIGVILVFFSAIIVLAVEFSADMIHTSQDGITKQKFFVSNDKSRVENQQGIAITRMDKNVMWMLMPEQKMYMEQPLDPRNVTAPSEKYPGEIERTLMGQEVIDGRITDKYRIVYTMGGIKTTVFQWFASDLGIPVKTASEDGSWSTEYKNIRIGSQPDSLFEIPAGYQKFSEQMPSTDDMYYNEMEQGE